MKPTVFYENKFLSAALCASIALLGGCSKDKDENKGSERTAVQRTGDVEPDLLDSGDDKERTSSKESRIPSYPELYCKHIYKLKLRHDVGQEISYFCSQDNAPTDDMRAMRERVLGYKDGYELRLLKEKHNAEKDTSDFILAWGYYVAIRPFEVKARPLYEFISKSIENDDTILKGVSARRPDDELDHGLHLWSADMDYDLSVKASNGLSLDSKRGTQYNMYQVESGNEEMGFGVESLRSDNPDYLRSVMINLSFNDGSGYNDGVGGTVVLNLLHITINNKGFPKTAAKTVDEIGKFLASEMYKGLKD